MTRYGILILSLACPLLHGQAGRVAGPVVGFLFDNPSRTVRPIQGVPGAAAVGAPMNLGLDVASAVVSPKQDSLFAIGADGSLHLYRLAGGAAAEISLIGSAGPAERVVFSPSGTAAALIASGKARLLSGLPDAPSVAGDIDLSLPRGVVIKNNGPAIPRRVTAPAMAISDDGRYLLNVAAGSLWFLSTAGENRRLIPAEVDALVAFAPGNHDASVIDRFGLAILHDVPGSALRDLVAPIDDGLASPVGLSFSADGRSLYVASSAAHAAALFDLQSGARRNLTCDCAPSGLVPMAGLFRLNDPETGPVWLLDTTTPRLIFVPAIPR
jgi:DNA-binding beta-propeller fold protein YncE